MRQWYEQPEDSREVRLFSDARDKKPRRGWVVFAVLGAIWAAMVVVAVLVSGCATAHKGPWKATLRISYVDGREIANAQGDGR